MQIEEIRRAVHLPVGSIQTDLARAWGQRQELDLSYSHGHSAVNLIVAVLYCHIFLTLGGTHDFLNTPKISKEFTININTNHECWIFNLCPFKSSITAGICLICRSRDSNSKFFSCEANAFPNTRNYYDIHVHVPQTFSPILHGKRDIVPTLPEGLEC